MDILLIQPWFCDYYQTSIRAQPLGLMMLRAVLQQRGYQVEIFDFLRGNHRQTISRPRSFAHLDKQYAVNDHSPAALYRQFFRFGRPLAELIGWIDIHTPRLIGISALFTAYLSSVGELASEIRKRYPSIQLMTGGHAIAAQWLAHRSMPDFPIDLWVIGEGEPAVGPIADYLIHRQGKLNSIPNSVYRKRGQWVENPSMPVAELDELPIPDRTHLFTDQFSPPQLITIVASRGCPYQCKFCSSADLWGHHHRMRSIRSLIREIDNCIAQYKIFHYNFEDDNLTYDLDYFHSLLNAIIPLTKRYQLTFTAMNGINYHALKKETLNLMVHAGFKSINFSIGTSHRINLKHWQRPADLTPLKAILPFIIEHKLRTTVYFIVGAPDHSVDDDIDTLKTLMDMPVVLGPSIFYLTPGQKLAQSLGLEFPTDNDYYRSTVCYPPEGTYTVSSKLTLLRMARWVNYLKMNLSNQPPLIPERYRSWLRITFENQTIPALLKSSHTAVLPLDQGVVQKLFSHGRICDLNNIFHSFADIYSYLNDL